MLQLMQQFMNVEQKRKKTDTVVKVTNNSIFKVEDEKDK